jgi:hypothetical protein
MVTTRSIRQKIRTIVMLTSSAHNVTLHFTAFRSNSLPNHRKNAVFLMQSHSLRMRDVKAYMVSNVEMV